LEEINSFPQQERGENIQINQELKIGEATIDISGGNTFKASNDDLSMSGNSKLESEKSSDVILRTKIKSTNEDLSSSSSNLEHDGTNDVTGNNLLESAEKALKKKNRESHIFIPCLFAKSHGCEAEIIDEDQFVHDQKCPLREVECDVIDCKEKIPIYLLNDHFFDRHQNVDGFSSPIKIKTKRIGKVSKILRKSIAISIAAILNLFF